MSKPIEASIFVVDDEPSIRELLVASLHFAGFEVNTAASGSEAIEVIEKIQPDLIVLDVMLPDIDGFTVTRRIRQEGITTPVLYLTARDDTQDKVMGLTVGGDDYVTKPFSLEEVVARIRAILRRTQEQVEDDPIIRVADLEINEDSHDVSRAGQPIDLSPTEYKLLRYLMDNEGRVLSKAQILDHVWQYDWGGDAAIVESYISYLRKKVDGLTVEDENGEKRKVAPLIETKRGIDITQQVKLTSVVKDAADDLHALDPDRGITCGQVVLQPGQDMNNPARLTFQPGQMPDITLTGDASRLRQVVTNIVGNIHRYTPADSPVEVSMGVLTASVSPESLSRMPSNEQSLRHLVEAIEVGQSMQVGMNYAIVRFSDHGPGVPAEARSKIFERFYTADPSRARQKGGTGLGMAIAQSVVKAHHGFICASGSEGTGLTLTVVLPVAPVEPRPLAQTSDERKGDKRGRRPKKQ